MSIVGNKKLLREAENAIEKFIGDISVSWKITFRGLEELQELISSQLVAMEEEHRKERRERGAR